MFAGSRMQGVCLRACLMQFMIVVVVAAACGPAVSVAWPASQLSPVGWDGAGPRLHLACAGQGRRVGWGLWVCSCMCGRWLRAGVTVSCRRALTHARIVQVAVRCCAGAGHGKGDAWAADEQQSTCCAAPPLLLVS